MKQAVPAPTVGTALAVLLALLLLTATTVAVAFVELPGPLHVAIAMAIAATKAGIVVVFFMHLAHETRASRLLAVVAFLLLAKLMLLVIVDITHLRG
jgi:cytochrome c oxidase subunit 4